MRVGPHQIIDMRVRQCQFVLNYQINDDSFSFLKQKFNPLAFRQTREMSLDVWANEVRQATNILVISNGHPITEREKTLVFCEDTG